MSASLNEVRLIGNLGGDPEVKTLNGDKTVATFRIATNETWKDSSGQKQERTEWHNVEVWGNQAKTAGQYLTKGRSVLVLGSLRTDSWEKDGQKHSKTKIVASRVVFLGSPDKGVVDFNGEDPA
jgi:single-strand DNA-binding protein